MEKYGGDWDIITGVSAGSINVAYLSTIAKGEEKLFREEKYAKIYEINMLRCIFCGLCEEACPKEAIFLTDRIVPSSFTRGEEVFGKDKLV